MQWYSERKHRCIEQIWKLTCDLMDTDTNVVLELGLVRLSDREDFYRRIDGTDYPLSMYVIDAPEAVRKQRVRDRNSDQGSTFRMVVSDEIFELANSAWQEPDESERRARNIEMIST